MNEETTTRIRDHVLNKTSLFMPIFSDMNHDYRGLLEKSKASPMGKMAGMLAVGAVMNSDCADFPVNIIEQQPVWTTTLAEIDTSDWAEMSGDTEAFKNIAGRALNETTDMLWVFYLQSMADVQDRIESGELTRNVDYVAMFYYVMMVQEGKAKRSAETIEFRLSVFPTQGKLED